MKDLNKLRLLAGIPIDGAIERTVKEAREVPKSRTALAKKDTKSLTAHVKGVRAAVNHVTNAIKSLEKLPSLDFSGDVPHAIHELEQILTGDGSSPGGLTHLLSIMEKELRSLIRSENAARREEEEALIASAGADDHDAKPVSEAEEADDVDEEDDSADDEEDDSAEDSEKEEGEKGEGEDPGSDETGESKSEVKEAEENRTGYGDSVKYYYDVDDGADANTEELKKDEGPSQLDALGEPSNSEAEEKVKVPASVKQALKDEIAQTRKEAEKLSVHNKDARVFYNDLARAFEDLLNFLEAGTVTDIKKAQIYWSSLMGPMIHKVPKVVSDFIVNGGTRRTLKSYMVKKDA